VPHSSVMCDVDRLKSDYMEVRTVKGNCVIR
jgi:hypothetical protein